MFLGDGSGDTRILAGLSVSLLIEVLMSERGVKAFERLIGDEKVRDDGNSTEAHTINTLRALVYAARMNGGLDIQEKLLLGNNIQRCGLAQKNRQLAMQFLFEDIDPERIACNLTHPDEALWLYALSRSIIRPDSIMGNCYLDQLAQMLRLPDTEKSEFERRSDRPRKKFTKDFN